MPTIDITIGPLEENQKRQIAKGFSKVLTDNGIPEEAITILFRHVTGQDVRKVEAISRIGRKKIILARSEGSQLPSLLLRLPTSVHIL
ncbi:hypothetical protein KDJ56_10660 [Brevibacillus composti]|uniref:4-oxalocrotonate tautomerase domain-containing protein n=1 Tax=Brevibacillus composti TaxID=2796470 RepID=A0A7T5EPH8_9BACL|nr:hypothetical protein [Brevibacillus composti]QQE76340.1 hypothetical protein JD108_10975 [Brevibacillus composti]QUO43367.1 hypothetical protein KDJ56_10660 [Brevibacillus composti]